MTIVVICAAMLAAVLSMATADAASPVELAELPICESVLGRSVDLQRCAIAHSDLVELPESAAAPGPPLLTLSGTTRSL